MRTHTFFSARRCAAAAAVLLAILLTTQLAVALASAPETYEMQQVVAQAATATPFRFLTPTPFVNRGTTTTTSTTSPTPQTGGFPVELALPVLAGGLAAIGGGSFLLRRRTSR
jgi:hypothetical protein